MSELFEKSIRVLELPRLLEMLEHHAVSAEAKARARRLTPSDDFGERSTACSTRRTRRAR